MRPRINQFPVLMFLVSLLCTPAYSESPIYKWKDSNGVINYGDDPANAPAGAKVTVWSGGTNLQEAYAAEPGDAETGGPEVPRTRRVTEGAFAAQLARELGLHRNPSPREAAEILSGVRIAPPRGGWDLNEWMTPELTVRLRQLSVAAASEGWIEIREDQALLAFDTAAAIAGLDIPLSGTRSSGRSSGLDAPFISAPEPSPVEPLSNPDAPDETSADAEPVVQAEEPPDAIDGAYPVLAVPPLITFVAPVPEFYSYYSWYPVAGGFWCNRSFFPGYFVFNSSLYFRHHNGYPGYHRLTGTLPGTIGGQIQRRIVNGQFHNFPDGRFIRAHATSLPPFQSMANHPSGPNRSSFRGGQSFLRYTPPPRASFSSPPGINSVSRFRPNGFNVMHRMSSYRPSSPPPSFNHPYPSSARAGFISFPGSFPPPGIAFSAHKSVAPKSGPRLHSGSTRLSSGLSFR